MTSKYAFVRQNPCTCANCTNKTKAPVRNSIVKNIQPSVPRRSSNRLLLHRNPPQHLASNHTFPENLAVIDRPLRAPLKIESLAVANPTVRIGDIAKQVRSGVMVTRPQASQGIIRTNYIAKHSSAINNEERGLVGLHNLGNTCYMNSSLQCLRCIRELNAYINKNERLIEDVAGNYFSFVKGIWNAGTAYDPRKIRVGVALAMEQFRNNCQHDAQEFLNGLLDTMHENLQVNGSSIVSDTFYGEYETVVTCEGCGNVSYTHEKFMFLTLPISENDDTLDGLFEKQSLAEYLCGENQYQCDNCRSLCNATKVTCVSKLPNTLIVHLKRFTKSRKINSFVNLPAEYGDHELVGVINHSGELDGGHYTANVKIKNEWYVMNDSSCRSVQENIVTHQAYILFYEKK